MIFDEPLLRTLLSQPVGRCGWGPSELMIVPELRRARKPMQLFVWPGSQN
jgi:hypothetical protein